MPPAWQGATVPPRTTWARFARARIQFPSESTGALNGGRDDRQALDDPAGSVAVPGRETTAENGRDKEKSHTGWRSQAIEKATVRIICTLQVCGGTGNADRSQSEACRPCLRSTNGTATLVAARALSDERDAIERARARAKHWQPRRPEAEPARPARSGCIISSDKRLTARSSALTLSSLRLLKLRVKEESSRSVSSCTMVNSMSFSVALKDSGNGRHPGRESWRFSYPHPNGVT